MTKVPSRSNAVHMIAGAIVNHPNATSEEDEQRGRTSMATLSFNGFNSIRLQPPIRFRTRNHGRRVTSVSAMANSLAETSLGKPEIELMFITLKAGADGLFPVDRAKAVRGEKLLRNIMHDNKIELHVAYIIEGKELLNERTNTELRYLNKTPESWKLACQTIMGNKENSGKVSKVVIQRLP